MKGTLDINPWLTIWIYPRRTIRSVSAFDPAFRFVWLSAIYAFPILLQLAQSLSLSLYLSLPVIILGALVLSPFLGMLGISIAAFLFLWIGKWLGGEATFYQVRTAIAWSNVPIILTGLSWVVFLFVFQGLLFYQGFFRSVFIGKELLLITSMGVVQSVASIWSIVLLICSLSEVQKFSVWKSILNIILPFILVAVLSWLALWIVWWN